MSIPGILSKTIHALELLQGRYDVFFRTNLSSVLKLSSFDELVQEKESICYSGGFVWSDGLRNDLLARDRVGPGRSVRSLSELNEYEGNTFISGSGYFLNASEAASLVERKQKIRYDLVDDVSIGLMLTEHETLRDLSLILEPDEPIGDMIDRIRKTEASHIRLQHFPLTVAQRFWEAFSASELWK